MTPLWERAVRLSSGISSVAAYTAPILDDQRGRKEAGGLRSVDNSADISEFGGVAAKESALGEAGGEVLVEGVEKLLGGEPRLVWADEQG
jgi:hypothetical protein